LSRKVAPYLLHKNQLVLSQDAYLYRGGFRKTSGHSSVLSAVPAAERGLSCRRVYDLISGNLTVVHLADGKAYRLSGARLGVIGSGFTPSARLSMTEANRLVYATDGVVMRLWSGTRVNPMQTATNPAEMPRYLKFHPASNRLFAARGQTSRNRVWFSNVNAFTTWNTNDFFDIPESRTGDNITGMECVLSNLVVFGERTVTVIYGRVPSDYTQRTLEWIHGCKYPNTIVSFGTYAIYLSGDGLYIFDGSGAAKKISTPIDDLLTDVNGSNIDGPVATIDRDGNYVLSYSSIASGSAALANNREITVIKPTPEVPYWSFQGPNTRGFGQYARYNGGTDSNEIYAVSAAADGQLYKLYSGKDYAGTGADMDIITGQLDFGAPFVRKVFQGMELHVETYGDYAIEIQYKIDGEPNWQPGGSVSMAKHGPEYGTRSLESVNRAIAVHPLLLPVDTPVVGNYIQFRFRQRGVGGVYQPVNIMMWRAWAKSWRAG